MPTNPHDARDQMSTLFKTAVDASLYAATLVPLWDDVDGQEPEPPSPATQKHWCRFKIRHATGGVASISGANGRRRYRRGGFIVVQLFTIGGKGLQANDDLVAIILAGYEGKTTSGGVIFRNGRFQEVGQDGPWFQTNVLVDFEYDEVK